MHSIASWTHTLMWYFQDHQLVLRQCYPSDRVAFPCRLLYIHGVNVFCKHPEWRATIHDSSVEARSAHDYELWFILPCLQLEHELLVTVPTLEVKKRGGDAQKRSYTSWDRIEHSVQLVQETFSSVNQKAELLPSQSNLVLPNQKLDHAALNYMIKFTWVIIWQNMFLNVCE